MSNHIDDTQHHLNGDESAARSFEHADRGIEAQ
jgi:hypothetical protein